MREAVSPVQSSNFGLKEQAVELIRAAGPSRMASLGVAELESFRSGASFVPASKNGLEVICGASCEVGAQ
ncbi:hypothetical protein [Dactylosporangium sp. NPDC051484]|uniref:hypothetical protein n=1 Tax=Dactylosporangium sp. NPDC051484 TaxID=3154942 RepID=UPI00344F60CC